MTAFALVTAAGASKRMGGVNKQLMPLHGKPVLAWTLEVFEETPEVKGIVVTGTKENLEEYASLVKQFGFKKILSLVEGGKERQDSVYNGLKELEKHARSSDVVLVHNGANPLILKKEVRECIAAAQEVGASVAAFPVKDTIKKVDAQKMVVETLERKQLWAMQTPQAMKMEIALEAFEKAMTEKFYGTDDVQLVERLGLPVKIVQCSYENLKITTMEDIGLAEHILRKRSLLG
jgi:2-C-methyl-D-erythritol 4-phosphate cytidylyltransferase